LGNEREAGFVFGQSLDDVHYKKKSVSSSRVADIWPQTNNHAPMANFGSTSVPLSTENFGAIFQYKNKKT
jgi:hypothetical protein